MQKRAVELLGTERDHNGGGQLHRGFVDVVTVNEYKGQVRISGRYRGRDVAVRSDNVVVHDTGVELEVVTAGHGGDGCDAERH